MLYFNKIYYIKYYGSSCQYFFYFHIGVYIKQGKMLLEPEKSKPICFRMGLTIDQPQEVIQTSSLLTYGWALQTWDMSEDKYSLGHTYSRGLV